MASGFGVCFQLLIIFIVGFVGLEVYTTVASPDAKCEDLGPEWDGEWVNESQPPEGEFGIVCTAPNGSTVNYTAADASTA